MILQIKKLLAAQLLPRNLRISAILISIYQVLISHVLLFVMLLGLVHAEEMTKILSADIADQREREDFVLVPTLPNGESLNSARFKTASHLAFVTLVILYIGTAISAIYLLSCLALLIGTLRNRPELMLPWLILDAIGAILMFAIVVAAANSEFNVLYYSGGEVQYWLFCAVMTMFNVMIWLIVFTFYQSIRQIAKLRQIAAVAIPMPGPDSPVAVYNFHKDSLYLGGGSGMKHYLSEHRQLM